MGRIIFIILTLLTTVPLLAQTEFKGTVSSMENEVLPNVSVIVKNTEDKILHFGFTKPNGEFSIAVNDLGTFVVEVNSLGYVKQIAQITIKAEDKKFTKNFVLEQSTEILEDMVIEIDNPIKLRGDTLVYDAKAFSTGREVVVEDLLKNIPGITVEKDGKIKFEDREIEKVMVDGDDFFNRGYSILTKNMPSKPLDKVEVLRHYSNNKLLKGVENSDAVALNLTIQDEYKSIWFGDLSLGYGIVTENRYQISGNLMNFGKKYKTFFTFGLNNIGYDNVGNIDDMFYNSSDMMSIGYGQQNRQQMYLSGGGTVLKDHRTRFNNAEMLSLNTIFPINPKMKLKLGGFLGYDELDAFRNSASFTQVGETSFENIEAEKFKSKLQKGYLNAFLTYDISKTKMLQIGSLFSFGNANNKNDLTFNGVSTLERLETKNMFFDAKATFTTKWKDKNAALVKARFFTNKIPQFYNINDYLMGDLFPYDVQSVRNDIQNNKTYGGIETDLKFKQKKDDLIEVKVGYEFSNQDLNTQFKLFTSDTQFIEPTDFQANINFQMHDFYAKSGYTWKWKKAQITANADVHQLFNTFSNSLHEQTTKGVFFVNPNVNAKWDINATNMLSGYYSYNFSNLDIQQVNDTYLLQSSRSFSKGVGEFNQLENSNASLNYSIRHYLNRFRFSFGITYSKQNDALAYRTSLEQNSSLSESFFIKGGDNYGLNTEANFYLRKLKSNLNLKFNASKGFSFNAINGSDLRKNVYESLRYNLAWRTNFKTAFNFHLGTEWTESKVQSPGFENTNLNGFSFLDLFYKLNDRLDVKAVTEHYYFGNLEKNQRDYFFLDIEATYKLKGDKYTIGLKANNVFNTEKFTTFNASDVGYSTTSYRLLPRYVLGSFKFRF
ncbi:hypothetical protein EG240_08810 [Paenimyroides tangerinum]|uniref:TonB-dependent receptor n=1 Tax=Paenimyroides tangerinum TaxID=2488728 RepID=A0A3P3W5G8_9FLAO|nr:carboxypeptidase-like regulatory domain-containing protein [Paenimyroides tangerinum]RRJ90342.1 hypothetical protein EG240_08810 [Paenimyroides tangerinum]